MFSMTSQSNEIANYVVEKITATIEPESLFCSASKSYIIWEPVLDRGITLLRYKWEANKWEKNDSELKR